MKPNISTFAKFYMESKKRVGLSKSRTTGLWEVFSVRWEKGDGTAHWKRVFAGARRRAVQARYREQIIRQAYWLLYGGSRAIPGMWVEEIGGPRDVLRKMWGERPQ